MRTTPLVWLLVSILAATRCGSSTPAAPAAPPAITVTASPNPIVGALCTGCGAGGPDRESKTTLTIRETAGTACTVSTIAMVLRDNSTNQVIAQGSFETAAVTQLAGTARIAASGTLVVTAGVHYDAGQAGRAATLTYTVRVTDDRGNQMSSELVVSVTT